MNAAAPITQREYRRLYQRPAAFTDFLPFVEYDPAARAFVFEDGISLGAMFELRPADAEARPPAFLEELRDRLANAVHALPETGGHPWVFQLYLQDEPLHTLIPRIEDYIGARAGLTPFAEHYLERLDAHLRRIARPDGLFQDAATGTRWGGRFRRVRATLYRRRRRGNRTGSAAADELNEAAERLTQAMVSAGIQSRRAHGRDLYEWLLPWFSPAGRDAEDPFAVLETLPYPDDDAQHDDTAYGLDLGEILTKRHPESGPPRDGVWRFGGLAHRFITLQGLLSAPPIGLWTVEQAHGRHHAAMFDRLPQGAIVTLTLTIQPQDAVRNHVERIFSRAVGDRPEAALAKESSNKATFAMAEGNKLLPMQWGVYLRGHDAQQLQQATRQTIALLRAAGLNPIEPSDDLIALNSYVTALPMVFDPTVERITKRSRLTWSRHVTNLLPLYGRGVGTGNPGLLFFNRAGEPLTFDPFNPDDRQKSAHAVILGPTGSGKSALLVTALEQIAAVHRPRIVIVDVGNSFGLWGEHMKRHGFSVNHVVLTPGSDVSLPPFAEAIKLLDDTPLSTAPTDHGDEGRDLLGEMEIAARVMITGGEAKEDERLTRPDRMVIRHALVLAAKTVHQAGGEQVMVADVVQALRRLADGARLPLADEPLPLPRRARAAELADAMDLFCSGIGGQFFNRPGQPWPDVDLTIVDMGILAREGYQDALTVTYIGLMSWINDRVERRQHEARPTLVVTDEAHVVTKNPLLAPYVVKISKMWRKFGAWLWLATQNLRDFPDASADMLNMAEWWLCLAMPKEEVEQIARFRNLTDEQKSLLRSARKEPGKYTEGVVMSDTLLSLFRNVPPPYCLALAQTEKHEKAERARIMAERGCTELEAAYAIADDIAHTGTADAPR